MRHTRTFLVILAGCLVFLQSVDFLLTWALLEGGWRSDVYESNPLALRVLNLHGWQGLAVWKVGCSAVALAAVLALARYRRALSVALLGGMCLVMGGVVGYSGYLLARPHDPAAEMQALRRESSELTYQLASLRRFDESREAICRELLEDKIGFDEAIEKTRKCIEAHRPVLPDAHRQMLPEQESPTGLAAYLYYHASRAAAVRPALRGRLRVIATVMAERHPKAPQLDSLRRFNGERPNWEGRDI